MVEKSIQSKPVEPEVVEKSSIERWVSTAARNHMVTGRLSDGTIRLVRFSDWVLELDLGNPEHAKDSEALRASGLNGTQVFEVNGKYPGHEVADDVAKLRRLRLMVTGEDDVTKQAGIEKLRSLFTRKELADAGQSYLTEDIDALIMLAIKLKKNV